MNERVPDFDDIFKVFFYENAEGIVFMIGLYKPTQNDIEGILFMYTFKNANITGILSFEEH